MALFDTIRAGASGVADTGFTVQRSLRFDDGSSHKLTRTFGTNTSNTTKTIAFWVKRSHLGTFQSIFATTSSGFIEGRVQFDNDDRLRVTDRDAGSGSSDINKVTDRKFRDVTAWYHIVVAYDTTNGTAADRVKIYVNGSQETDFSTDTNPAQSYATSSFRSSADNFIGANNTTDFFDGYLAEITFIDGQALTPSSFGETDSDTGQWNPIDTSGLTFGNNGFRLNFEDNSSTTASTQGKDISGNGNNFTPSNFGATNVDAVKDTPTNNFCTLSSITDAGALFGSSTLSKAGLRYTGGSSNRTIASTFSISHTDTTGYYFECKIISGNTANRNFVGIGYTSTNWINNDARGANDDSWVLRNGDGVFIHNSSVDGETSGAGALSVGDIIQIAVKGNKIWVGKNNTYLFSGNPAGDSTPKFSDIASRWTPVMDLMTSNVNQFNFGQDSSFSGAVTAQGNTDGNGHGDFYYTPPTGFFALCSKNLPNPTIPLPTNHFDTLLYTGNGGSQSITGLNFQPDWVWMKARDFSSDNAIVDAVRGRSKIFYPSQSQQENTSGSSNDLVSFDSNGFTLGPHDHTSSTNKSGVSIVAWNWNAGGSTVTNNNGSISAQVRASTTAGISIISYTGGGSAGTIGHGLGVAPDVIITKRRSGTEDWKVFHKDVPGGHFLKLNETQAETSNTNVYPNTAPTSTVYSVGSHDSVTGNSDTYMAYCFTSVEGFSKFGEYTGNGNAYGNTILTGFRPAWLMVKLSTGDNWYIVDNKRDPFNAMDHRLFADVTSQEGGVGQDHVDFLSNGFKWRKQKAPFNNSGSTYYYFCFAEAPFKNARAR